MKVQVKLLCEKGRIVPRAQQRTRRGYIGAFSLQEMRSNELGRSCYVANLHSDLEGLSEPVLPPLLDAAVIHAEDGRLRVRGFEVLDGMQLGQTWDVKVLPC